MRYFEAPILENYADCERMFSTVRTPTKGKPIRQWCRLFKHGDVFQLKYQEWRGNCRHVIAEFRPNGSITLPSDSMVWRDMHITLSNALHRVIPIITERMGKGRYRIGNTDFLDRTTPTSHQGDTMYRSWWGALKEHGIEYFEGMAFDSNGVCINVQHAVSGEVDPEKRKVWLRMLKRFKRGLKARAKVGALQQHAKRIYDRHAEMERDGQHRWQWQMPNWNSEKYYSMLKDSMQSNEFTPEFLDAFVESATPNTYGNTLATDAHILAYVDTLMNDLSYQLRKDFGVFVQEPLTADRKVVQR
jgi:hypothetical protein